ncbi:MAG: hypothetical protein J5720_02565 [Bacteroidaceae bacterium]|nr:hypothetical protein [Bacteroidaceae bacterium]
MKRTIISCLTLMLAISLSAQQNIGQAITVHMKDGTKVVYQAGTRLGLNVWGDFEKETISNFPNPGEEPTVRKEMTMGSVNFQSLSDYGEEASYIAVERLAPGQYSAKMKVNSSFGSNHVSGTCISTKENPTWGEDGIGKKQTYDYCIFGAKPEKLSIDEEERWCDYPLELGQTYYVRPFAAVYYNPDATNADPNNRVYTTFYGEELNFRVPDSISDHYWYYNGSMYCGRYTSGAMVATQEAWNVFSAKHAGKVLEDINNYYFRYKSLDGLLSDYIATGAAVVRRAETYDDGTVYFVDEVPDAFIDFVNAYYQQENTPQEMVYQHLISYLAEGGETSGRYTKSAVLGQIANVDPSWNIPTNSYLYVTPTTASANPTVGIELPKFVPGKYKILITMAPETVAENNEENASKFLPSKFRITLYEANLNNNEYPTGGARMTNAEGGNDFIIPADKTSTIELEYEFTSYRAIIQLQANVLSKDRSTYSRCLRIAEIRLVPVVE